MIVYNPVTNELGIIKLVNKMLLIDFGYGTIYKVYTNDWIEVTLL